MSNDIDFCDFANKVTEDIEHWGITVKEALMLWDRAILNRIAKEENSDKKGEARKLAA